MNLKKTIFLIFLISLHSHATEEVKWSDVTLVSPYKTISKDTKKIQIALLVNLHGGWHSYWQNPGESGKPLRAKWHLPEGSSIQHLNWPLPTRLKFGSLTNFVYKKPFLLISELILPKKKSEEIKIRAEVDWLICKEVCIPVNRQVELTLKVSETMAINAKWEKIFSEKKSQLPQKIDTKLTLQNRGNERGVLITTQEPSKVLDFFPLQKNSFSLLAPSVLSTENGLQHYLSLSPFQSESELKNSQALIVVKNKKGKQGFIYTFTEQKSSLLWFVLLAFLGGLLLNFMPCVLPIVFLKFSNTLEQAKEKKQTIVLGNLFYSAGVTSTFVLLALTLKLLQKGGESLGWGFQMQSPYFLIGIIFLFILLTFNFMGWFSISLASFPILQKDSSNYFKHFLTGILSTAAASPCTVPFMGAAVGYAFLGNTVQMMVIFIFLGLGLSFPYLLLSIFPHWIQYLPTPGKWSSKLKQFMTFPMLATSAWLIHLLNQLEPHILLPLLLSLLLFSFAFWLINNTKKRIYNSLFIILLLLFSLIFPYFTLHKSKAPEDIQWQVFSIQKMEKLIKKGDQHVFINFTADWCLTCKLNEQITFKNKKVIEFIKENNIHTLKGDWTHKQSEISQILTKYNRSGIPFYLYFPAGTSANKPGIVLPELLTPGIFFKYLQTKY